MNKPARPLTDVEPGAATHQSGFRQKADTCFAVRFHGRTFVLTEARMTVGRHPDCDIWVDGDAVSRLHARLTTGARGVVIEDLGSRNGITVNGRRIDRATWLRPGDRFVLGDELFEVIEEALPEGSGHKTLETETEGMLGDDENEPPSTVDAIDDNPRTTVDIHGDPRRDHEPTRRSDPFELLSYAVDEALAFGDGSKAERILSGHLAIALENASAGVELSATLNERAALYALRLASATGKAGWVDYAFNLYSAQDRVMPMSVVERLTRTRIHSRTVHTFRGYVAELQQRLHLLGPEEQRVVARLQSLLKTL